MPADRPSKRLPENQRPAARHTNAASRGQSRRQFYAPGGNLRTGGQRDKRDSIGSIPPGTSITAIWLFGPEGQINLNLNNSPEKKLGSGNNKDDTLCRKQSKSMLGEV